MSQDYLIVDTWGLGIERVGVKIITVKKKTHTHEKKEEKTRKKKTSWGKTYLR